MTELAGDAMWKLRSIIIAAVVAFFSLPTVAHAITTTDETFVFIGGCSDCGAGGGSGTASATLVLTDYTQGTTLQTDNFVSFTYTSIVLGTLSVDSSEFQNFSQNFSGTSDLTDLPGPATLAINWVSGLNDYQFQSQSDGTWSVEVLNGSILDVGYNGMWAQSATQSTTPLPAALPLFATGLGAIGLFGWRRKRKSAAEIAAA
jgi:hypothetical protein